MTISAFFSLPTHRETLRLAWPIILSNSSVPLLGAVDTAVVGHLPEPHYIGAVAIGALIFSFLYWGFGFLRMGTTGFVAQASGQEDATEVRSVLARALILSGIIAVIVLILQAFVLWLALLLIEGSAEVEGGAADYFFVRIWGAPAVLANYALMGFFIGIRNTKAALTVQIFMNGLNIILDLIFVIGFGWNVIGVAAATVISESLALLLGLYIVRRELAQIGGVWKRSAILSLAKMGRLLAVNFDIFIRTILLIFAFAYFTAQAAKEGDVTLAAVAVLMNFMHFMAFGLDGFAFAAEGMVGTAVGAKKIDKLREIVYVSGFWALVVACLYALVYLVFGPLIINLLTGIEEVRLRANEFLPWLIGMPLVAIWSYQLDGIFIGAVQSKEMRNGMIISFAAYMSAMFLLGSQWGTHGFWAALIVFFVLRAVTLAVVYPRVEQRAGA
ncbi:MATE family efflux transporter [Sneathiella litorea]|uniref:MATE family efflux transporter n=1 Tax=Sneathiella litorea TaxID=2606216 RepID=A0A6L8WAE6_9PROT|nr:MATE family efflux transporter [Sneathiella litorea]MZR31127.1 MATE family efflux transporter [Sneathiella litorea]